MNYDFSAYTAVLRDAFEKNSLSRFATDGILGKLAKFAEFLLTENEKYNLTAIKDPNAASILHFADSLTISSFIPDGASLLDIGSGAGFPAIPLAIARPDLKIVALDSTQKRIDFIRTASKLVGLTNISAICGRAEDLVSGELRHSFDFVTARAVAAYPVLVELCTPALKIGGIFAAMKGSGASGELVGVENATRQLGISVPTATELALTDGRESYGRCIVICQKLRITDPKYPRPYAQIKKKPIY